MRALPTLLALVLPLLPLSAQAGPLNDTGVTFCGAYPSGNTAAPCTPNPAGQDKQYGRDAAAAAGKLPAKTGGGEAGFDFTRICMSGEAAGQGACPGNPALGETPNAWACTRDNVTGLIWEVKTASGLRNQSNTYTNYDDPSQAQKWNGSAYVNPTQAEIDAATNSIGFANAVNALTGASRLCGATDWRRPGKKELVSIVHYGRTAPSIDPDYFPNTPSWGFWSGSPVAGYSNYAWGVYFYYGYADFDYRDNNSHVRLVRGGQ